MSMINIDHFGGEIPRLGRELLPDGAAQLASNALLLSGELRGLHFPQFIQDLTSVAYAIGSFWRIPSSPADEWVTFASKDTNFVKGPLVNDAYDRYYWTTDGSVPQYNTLARIKNDDPPYILGAPQPVLVPRLLHPVVQVILIPVAMPTLSFPSMEKKVQYLKSRLPQVRQMVLGRLRIWMYQYQTHLTVLLLPSVFIVQSQGI
jgi:hypothetical protein